MNHQAPASRLDRGRTRFAILTALSVLLLSWPGAAQAQDHKVPPSGSQAAPIDPFARIGFLIGRWEGTSEGQPGSGKVQREYTRELKDKFIRGYNRNVYAAQPKNPKGEVHEDVGFFSVDRARKRVVLRQFHVEGFVTQYVEDAAADQSRVVMISEAMENLPAGFRARETYVQLGPDEFEEIFEISAPGKDFEVYSRARLKRVK